MSDLRAQGRPCRGEAEVGREKILVAFRGLLRSGQSHDLSRKAVAAYAGVTPALISYYFAKKEQLLFEAVTPVVTAYADEICQVVDAGQPTDDKLKRVVAILVRLFEIDGKIIDMYSDVAARNHRGIDQIARIKSALGRIFGLGEMACSTQDLDALILQGAIWGICRFAAQAEQAVMVENDAPRHERLPARLAATLLTIVGHIPTFTGNSGLPAFSSAVG